MMQLSENAFFGVQNRYRLIRMLGRGGFSEVWQCEDTQAGLTVALKVYAPGRGLDEDGVKQFSNEFSLVFNLNHSNLLRPTHYDVFERMPYLIMPFCEHGSSIKQKGKIKEATAWKYLHDVASGLAYLHAQEPPVIHQDIKLDNVLMDSSGAYLITDFGISSKARSTLRQSIHPGNTAGAGTMAYMAPERFSKDNLPIKAGDVWALGASLYELMTGDPPFGDHGGLLLKGGAEIPDISGNWSKNLRQIIGKCLQKDPWNRPTAQTVAEFAGKYLSSDIKNPKSEPETVAVSRPANQMLMIACLAIVLLLGFGAGFVTGYFTKTKSSPLPPPQQLNECIQYIEQADMLSENESSWFAALTKYQEAKQMMDEHSLQLPNLDYRIERLQFKMDFAIKDAIFRANNLFKDGSPAKALSVIEDEVLSINPDHEEGKTLQEKYRKAANQTRR